MRLLPWSRSVGAKDTCAIPSRTDSRAAIVPANLKRSTVSTASSPTPISSTCFGVIDPAGGFNNSVSPGSPTNAPRSRRLDSTPPSLSLKSCMASMYVSPAGLCCSRQMICRSVVCVTGPIILTVILTSRAAETLASGTAFSAWLMVGATQVLAATTTTSTHAAIRLFTGEEIFMVYPHRLRTQSSHTHGPTTLQNPLCLVVCCPLWRAPSHGQRHGPLWSEGAQRGRQCDGSPHTWPQGTTWGVPVGEVGQAGQKVLPHTRACRPPWSRPLRDL